MASFTAEETQSPKSKNHAPLFQTQPNKQNSSSITKFDVIDGGSVRFGSFILEGNTVTYEVITNEDGSEFIRHGNLESTRTYAHIDDAISAYWVCSNSNKFGEVYNIGGSETCTVGDALDKLISMSTKNRLDC